MSTATNRPRRRPCIRQPSFEEIISADRSSPPLTTKAEQAGKADKLAFPEHSDLDEFGFDRATGRAAFDDGQQPRPRRTGLVL